MDSNYIQYVGSGLQKRLKRLNAAPKETFRSTLVQTWDFLQNNEITKGILDALALKVPEIKEWTEHIVMNGGKVRGGTEVENAGIAYGVVKSCATLPLDKTPEDCGNGLLALILNVSDQLDWFRLEYLGPLFDYIDEQIDDKRVTLALLRKYKHRCEWFRRTDLLAKCREDSRKGENTLANDLYEYLHDQGIQFHIEPHSASGRIDLVSSQSGKDRLVADAKIFNPEGGQDRGHIIGGFRQIYDYTKDYNGPFGYLVIFKTCVADLSISTPHQESAVPFITHNNKTIFLVVIDICDYRESASKRGKLQAHEITVAQFIEAIPAG